MQIPGILVNCISQASRLVTLIVLLSFISCQGGKEDNVRNQIHVLLGEKINLDTKNMDYYPPIKASKKEIRGKDYRLIVFLDSMSCTPCEIDRLYEWNALIENMNTVDFIFIVAPKDYQKNEARISAKTCGLRSDLYIDKSYSFRKGNSFVPDDNKYHTFLINKDNEVVLVGDPLRNAKVKGLSNM